MRALTPDQWRHLSPYVDHALTLDESGCERDGCNRWRKAIPRSRYAWQNCSTDTASFNRRDS